MVASWALASLGVVAGARMAPAADAAVERPYSVQLHLHGSASEGVASIDSHSYEARDVGADVLWWSDHDFRIASYHHATSFGFEGWEEPLAAGETWRDPDWLPRGRGDDHGDDEPRRKVLRPGRSTAAGGGEISSERADDGERSLHLHASGTGDRFAELLYQLRAARAVFKRPLFSRVALELSVFPEQLGPDARVVVQVVLSEHSPRPGAPDGNDVLRYVLDNERTTAERRGRIWEVPVAYRTGEWNRLVLQVTRDAVAGFPMVHAEDNSMVGITLGVETRRGATADVFLDRFRIAQELAGTAAYRRQGEIIREVAAEHPGLVQLQGVEISYASDHLNEFSVDTRLLDYDRVLADVAARGRAARGRYAPQEEVARAAIADAHRRGGLVSYNHMFGAAMEGGQERIGRDAVLAKLLATQAYGADILEVGYRDRGGHDLADHLWVWDRLTLAGLPMVGVGVSDSHGGPRQRWRTAANNFLSWIYARSPSKPDLLEGLRAGRVFFGDITLFGGRLDLSTARGARMGQVVLTDRADDAVEVAITGLAEGDVVRVVRSGEPIASLSADGATLRVRQPVALAADGPTALRVEVDGADGTAKVLSNPITWMRRAPDGGLPDGRAAVDVGGVASRRIERFRVTAAEARRDGDGSVARVAIAGRGQGGTIALDASALGEGVAVTLQGLSGAVETGPSGAVVARDLRGEGVIELRRGS